jgi:hypothetical protein
MHLQLSLEGPDLELILKSVFELEFFREGVPEFDVDNNEKKITPDWLSKYIPLCKRDIHLMWDELGNRSITFSRNCIVKFRVVNEVLPDLSSVLPQINSIDWEVISFGTMHTKWLATGMGYSSPGFANLHYPLGWGCAFKGEGHQRVVSRRYLDYGPWHVIRDEANDITLIQLHDLNADALTALEQAKPGHKLMGDPYEGGFIQRDYTILNPDFSGLYDPTNRMLRFIINERPITRAELLDACATRLWQLLGEDKPIERIGYVFIQESEARQNLHELWLREIECWTYLDGVETRIDEDYSPPPPERPEWVRQLET